MNTIEFLSVSRVTMLPLHTIILLTLLHYAAGQIPRIVHFTWTSSPTGRPFNIAHYIAVQSAYTHIRPEKMFFWYEHLPTDNAWWNYAQQYVQPMKVEALVNIHGRDITEPEKKSDYLRLLKLYEFGGIYMDLDVIITQPLDYLLNESTVMFYYHPGRETLGCSLVLTRPNAPFMQRWLSMFDRPDALSGDYMCTACSTELWLKYPEEITVGHRRRAYHPAWDGQGKRSVFAEDKLEDETPWARDYGAYAFHIWESNAYWFYDWITPQLIEKEVFEKETRFNQLIRPYLLSVRKSLGYDKKKIACVESTERNIPLKVHFVWWKLRNFNILHYVAIKAAFTKLNGPNIMFWYRDLLPRGNPWWELALKMITPVQIKDDSRINCPHYDAEEWHLERLMGLTALREEGGILLSIDTILLRSIQPWMNRKLVMIQVGESANVGISSALVMAQSNRKFISDLVEKYKRCMKSWVLDAFAAKRKWLVVDDEEITILDHRRAFHPSWGDEDINKVFEGEWQWERDQIAYRAWEFQLGKWASVLDRIMPDSVEGAVYSSNAPLYRMFHPYLQNFRQQKLLIHQHKCYEYKEVPVEAVKVPVLPERQFLRIRTHHDSYLCAVTQSEFKVKKEPDSSCEFEVIFIGESEGNGSPSEPASMSERWCYLKSRIFGMFVSSTLEYRLALQRHANEWERLKLVELSDGRFAIKSWHNTWFVGFKDIVVLSKVLGEWERFEIEGVM